MNIALDARWIYPQISGIGSHTRELIRHLVPSAPPVHRFYLLFNHADVMRRVMEEPALRDASNAEPVLLSCSPFAPASQWILPRFFREKQVDLFHSTNYMIPLAAFPRHRLGQTACVISIHDMIPLLHPEFTPRALKTRFLPLFRALMRAISARTDAIITVSECSRRDVIETLRLPPPRHSRVVVIPNGVDARYRPLSPARRRPVILYVGRLDPYKNVSLLIRAFAGLLPQHPGLRLRIIGPTDDRYPEPRQLIQALGLAPHVDWDGYLSDDLLLEAYQTAAVLVLPSLYEGFGLPVVEAMACATPVVCCNTSSLPEIAGDAALLVPPDDPSALAHAIQRILADPELAGVLATRGLAQAARFSWNNAAAQTLALYESFQ